jgi:transcription termination factor Rho
MTEESREESVAAQGTLPIESASGDGASENGVAPKTPRRRTAAPKAAAKEKAAPKSRKSAKAAAADVATTAAASESAVGSDAAPQSAKEVRATADTDTAPAPITSSPVAPSQERAVVTNVTVSEETSRTARGTAPTAPSATTEVSGAPYVVRDQDATTFPAASPSARAFPQAGPARADDAQNRSFEPRLNDGRPSEGRPGEGRNVDLRPVDLRGSEQRPGDVRPGEPRSSEPRPNEPRVTDNRPAEARGYEGRQFDTREVRDDRVLQGRGLRFRGRDGRAEIRGRDNRDGRNDNRNERGFRDNRGYEPRGFEPRDNDNPRSGHAPRDAAPRELREANQNRGDFERHGGFRPERGERDNARENQREAARNRNDLDLTTLEDKNVNDLRAIATDLGIPVTPVMKKTDIVFRILEAQAETSGNLFKQGILEILPDGKGFLRTEGYLPGNEDVYISQSQIKRFNLRTGDMVSGQVRAPKEMERYYGLLRVEATNGEPPDITKSRKEFEKLTPIFPDDKFALETTQENITARVIDMVSPIGKGQRGLIVAPPKAGKTTLIKNIANSIVANHPEVYLIVLLIDERPEEVTDISRSVKGEVVASTFDEMPENHIRVADMVLEKAKRMVEQKKDVVILLDSITRLSRASNLVVTPSGRTMSGGLDPAAMHKPKRLFGAARNIEEGGSLTILATVLVDTGSRMDEYIFEELKGTGNMDLVLDRSLFDMRIFPPIDINRSGTRRDDLLLSKEDLAAVFHLRRTLSALDNDKAITLLIDRLKNTKTNTDFLQIVQKSARQGQVQGQGPTPVP